MNDFISGQIKSSMEVNRSMLADGALINSIAQVAAAAVRAYRAGNKLLLAGNGGSAGDCQHIAGELVNRFRFDRPALPAIALSTDSSVMTAIGNDSSFDEIFSRQVEALGSRGDMFIGISTSRNSTDVLRALECCAKKGLIRVGMTGQGGGKMASLCDYFLSVPSRDTPRIQEAHIMIAHIFCDMVERSLFGKAP